MSGARSGFRGSGCCPALWRCRATNGSSAHPRPLGHGPHGPIRGRRRRLEVVLPLCEPLVELGAALTDPVEGGLVQEGVPLRSPIDDRATGTSSKIGRPHPLHPGTLRLRLGTRAGDGGVSMGRELRRFIILHAASLRARRGTLCLDRGTAGSLVAARGGTDRVGSGGVSHDGIRRVAPLV